MGLIQAWINIKFHRIDIKTGKYVWQLPIIMENVPVRIQSKAIKFHDVDIKYQDKYSKSDLKFIFSNTYTK